MVAEQCDDHMADESKWGRPGCDCSETGTCFPDSNDAQKELEKETR